MLAASAHLVPPSTSALQLSTPASSVTPSLSTLPPLDSTPWLQKRAFPASPLHDLAAQIDALAVHDLALCKAFDQRNSADSAFASDLPSVQWLSTPQLRPPALLGTDATLAHALEHSAGGAPMSARVATAGESAATPALGEWLDALGVTTGRSHRDADAYVTPGGSLDGALRTSASLGFHIDDVDVLLVMLRGAKRFRVAGREVGSEVEIDWEMCAGDAIYIPALYFHSGGTSPGPSSAIGRAAPEVEELVLEEVEEEEAAAAPSMLLSVAMRPCAAEDAEDAVRHWKRARDAVRRRLPSAACNSWQWAHSTEGAEHVRTTLHANAEWRRFARGQQR